MKVWVDGSKKQTCHIIEGHEPVLTPLPFLATMPTVNEGEYFAVIDALEDCFHQNILEVDLFSDSEVIVRQLQGDYKCRASNLKPLRDYILSLAKSFDSLVFTWICREDNPAGHVLEKLK